MKYIKTSILLSLALSVVAKLCLVTQAQAQSYPQSSRYPTDREIQSLQSEFERLTRGITGRGYSDTRSAELIRQRESFVKAWERVNPSISSFLGTWTGMESSLTVFPSRNKDQVCILLSYYDVNGMVYLVNVGKVSGRNIYSSGDLGKVLFIRKTGKLASGNSTDFLAQMEIRNGGGVVLSYTLPTPLESPVSNRIKAAGCTNTTP